jgi:hypothetical protein
VRAVCEAACFCLWLLLSVYDPMTGMFTVGRRGCGRGWLFLCEGGVWVCRGVLVVDS